MSSILECVTIDKENLGLTDCNKLPGLLRGIITTPYNFKFTLADAVDPVKWQEALLAAKSSRVYLFPWFVGYEDIMSPAVYQETVLAYLAVRDGNYRWRFDVKENLCIHKAMYSHRSNHDRVWLIDDLDQIMGTRNAAGTHVMGFTQQLLHTEKMKFSNGTESTTSPIVIALQNNKEFDKNGVIIDASFVNELLRIVDVELTIVGVPSLTTIVVDAKIKCTGQPLNGLALADFVLKTTAGATQTITSFTEVDGRYTLTDTDFATGTLTLKPPATLSIQAYEANTVVVTVV